MLKDELYLIRKKKKIKLRELAEYMKVSVAFISYYENDERTFNSEKMEMYKEFIINYVPKKK